MDMVTSAKPEKKHDFDTDPIEPIINGKWLLADRTTLGADDAIGMSAALALLEDKAAVHGPLEALFTADEETTMVRSIHELQLPPLPSFSPQSPVRIYSHTWLSLLLMMLLLGWS